MVEMVEMVDLVEPMHRVSRTRVMTPRRYLARKLFTRNQDQARATYIVRRRALLLILVLLLDCGLQLYLKFAMKTLRLHLPILFVVVQMAFAWVCLKAYTGSPTAVRYMSKWPIKLEWRQLGKIGPILFCAVCYACQATGNNESLERVSVSFNQIIKAACPAIVLLLAIPLEKKKYPVQTAGTAILLFLGCTLAALHIKEKVSEAAWFWTLLTAATFSVTYCMFGRLMRTDQPDLVPLLMIIFQLVFWALLPLFFVFEW